MSGEPTVDEADLTPRELKLMADITLARVDLLDLLKVCGIETAGTMAFGEDLVAVRKYVENLKAAHVSRELPAASAEMLARATELVAEARESHDECCAALPDILTMTEGLAARVRELEGEREPYCDVCGQSGKDLRTDVEVCRDCYDIGLAGLGMLSTTIPKSSPLEVELILALSFAIEIIEHEVPPKAFDANTGPDADGDDANAFYLGQTLRRIRATLEKTRGEEGPATVVSKLLGELPSK